MAAELGWSLQITRARTSAAVPDSCKRAAQQIPSGETPNKHETQNKSAFFGMRGLPSNQCYALRICTAVTGCTGSACHLTVSLCAVLAAAQAASC